MTSSKPVRSHHNSRNNQPRRDQPAQVAPTNRFKVVYIIISALVICSLIAVTLATIDLGGLFSDDEDAGNYVDPNADLIAEQRTVVAENPEDVDQVLLLANLLANTGNMNEAVPLYERAIELEPDDPSVRLDFAQSLMDSGLRPDAEAQFLRVLESEPDNQTAHYYLAELYMGWDSPRQDEATEHYQRAVEIDPESFLGQRAQNRLDTMGTPVSSPISSPQTQRP